MNVNSVVYILNYSNPFSMASKAITAFFYDMFSKLGLVSLLANVALASYNEHSHSANLFLVVVGFKNWIIFIPTACLSM